MNKREQKRQLAIKRFALAKNLAKEEGYELLTIYKKKKGFIVYEGNDMFKMQDSIYIVVEYDDNIPYLAIKKVVDEM